MPAERVLLVDDSATQLEATHALLADAGYHVTAARSGEEALAIARTQPFDVVVSDVVMPGMSGYDLCATLKRELGRRPVVVLLTTLSDPRDIVRGVESGADNYVTKPYDPQRLLERLRHALENARLRAEQPPGGPVAVTFLGEHYTISSDPHQILALLLSSFEELIRTNDALQASQRQLADAHARELKHEQEARARAEADARRMELLKQRAEAATRVRDDVLATVSHDLKNPVGTIFTSATLLLEMPLPPEGQQRQIEIIRRTAERMDRLIQDLLAVSRMEAGGFSVAAKPENAASLVVEARDLHSTLAEARQIALTCNLPDDDVFVSADRSRVLQVFSNLIGNAIKFTPGGGHVALEAQLEGDQLRFSVTDTGPGIAPADLPRVFERFWHSGDAGGSGLGLAIARHIVEAHGGRIWAESEGGGSTFAFTLQLVPAEAPASD